MVFAESNQAEHNIRWIKRAGVTKVEKGLERYKTLDGEKHTQDFVSAMLIPPFADSEMKTYNKNRGGDISSMLFAPNGLMKVCDSKSVNRGISHRKKFSLKCYRIDFSIIIF